MKTLVDDIGSFPLPARVNRETYNKAYQLARDAMTNGHNISEDKFIRENFYDVTINSFKLKMSTGLDVVNTPWHYDGVRQINDAVHKAMETGTFVVDEKDAFLPEVRVVEAEAKRLYEEFGKKIALRACMFGPMELYLQEIGTVAYRDVLAGFSETIRRFAKNSIVNTKYVKTEVISIDEPSFGFMNINAEREVLIEVLEKACDFKGAVRQIHLHSASRIPEVLKVGNIDVVSFEYGASPQNIESVSRKMLDDANKQIRVGVTRTDIGSIMAELNDKGTVNPTAEELVEKPEVIRKRYLSAKQKYGDHMTFTGPDCGLGGWPSQETAQLLLKRTVDAIKKPYNFHE
jgi:5-methyltetrahydropteroyltriglutamate--homocysteine methyltransferase